jgi:arginyl-tRNA--protein-N-Asp/Glu arginylyltransferase
LGRGSDGRSGRYERDHQCRDERDVLRHPAAGRRALVVVAVGSVLGDGISTRFGYYSPSDAASRIDWGNAGVLVLLALTRRWLTTRDLA